jgi:hypothetical protein
MEGTRQSLREPLSAEKDFRGCSGRLQIGRFTPPKAFTARSCGGYPATATTAWRPRGSSMPSVLIL